MKNIEDIASEVIVAKEQLKQINATINNDREVVKGLENQILEKNKELEDLEKQIKEKNEEIISLDGTKKWIEEEKSLSNEPEKEKIFERFIYITTYYDSDFLEKIKLLLEEINQKKQKLIY